MNVLGTCVLRVHAPAVLIRVCERVCTHKDRRMHLASIFVVAQAREQLLSFPRGTDLLVTPETREREVYSWILSHVSHSALLCVRLHWVPAIDTVCVTQGRPTCSLPRGPPQRSGC